MRPILLISLATLLAAHFSCTSHKNTRIQLHKVGDLRFRKTFADLQFIDDQKEQDRYIERQEKSRPQLTLPTNDTIKKLFEKFDFVKEHELILDRFKYDSSELIQLHDATGDQITIRFDFIPGRDFRIVATKGSDSSFVTINNLIQPLKFALLDVIPGGNKEIVLLTEYYVMMGYNFDFTVYEF